MGVRTISLPTINPTQQGGLETVTEWLERTLATRPGAAPYTGQLTPGTPQSFTDAFNQFTGSNQFSDLSNNVIRDLISGKPAYEFDEGRTARVWQDSFAAPVMQAWRDVVLPGLKEDIGGVPGNLYSRGLSESLGQQTSDFFGQNVVPSFYNAFQQDQSRAFQSGEAAAGRQFDALDLPYNQFANQANAAALQYNYQSAPLNAAYAEFQRTDPGQYAGLLGNISTVPTIENFAFYKGKSKSNLGGLIGAGAGFLVGGVPGAAAGATIGGAF